MVRAYWLQTRRVGDEIAPFILKRMFDDRVYCDSRHGRRWLVGGELVRCAKRGDILFGTGSTGTPPPTDDLEVVFVRGPLTAKTIGVRPQVFGDAGTYLPVVYAPKPRPPIEVGIVPYYGTARCPRGSYRGGYIIDTVPVDVFIDRIVSCRVVAASSLIAISIAEAYGVPAIRLALPEDIGDKLPDGRRVRDYEYMLEDYYAGTWREVPKAAKLEDIIAGNFSTPQPVEIKSKIERLTYAVKTRTVAV